jgi:hypothetical protein
MDNVYIIMHINAFHNSSPGLRFPELQGRTYPVRRWRDDNFIKRFSGACGVRSLAGLLGLVFLSFRNLAVLLLTLALLAVGLLTSPLIVDCICISVPLMKVMHCWACSSD